MSLHAVNSQNPHRRAQLGMDGGTLSRIARRSRRVGVRSAKDPGRARSIRCWSTPALGLETEGNRPKAGDAKVPQNGQTVLRYNHRAPGQRPSPWSYADHGPGACSQVEWSSGWTTASSSLTVRLSLTEPHSRSEVDLREVQTCCRIPSRHGRDASTCRATLVVEQLGGTSWRDSRGRARGAKRAGLRWPSCWAATSRSSSHALSGRRNLRGPLPQGAGTVARPGDRRTLRAGLA